MSSSGSSHMSEADQLNASLEHAKLHGFKPKRDLVQPKAVIFIIFYSAYHHTYQLANSVADGVRSTGADARLFLVPETLSPEILAKLHSKPTPNVPVIQVADLPKADGFIFGCPTRFGMPCAQIKSFFDATGSLWQSGALVGKVASTFFSSATQGGGQETTAWSLVPNLAHHGLIFVPPGYTNPKQFDMEEVHGGSPWGAGTLAGPDGSREVSKLEQDLAVNQGKVVANVAIALKTGRDLIAAQAKPAEAGN